MKYVSGYWKLTKQDRAAITYEDLGDYYYYQKDQEKEWLDVPVEECNDITADWLLWKLRLSLANVAKWKYQASRFSGLSEKKAINNTSHFISEDRRWVNFDEDLPKRKK